MSVQSAAETSGQEANSSGAERRVEPRFNCPKLVRIRPVTVPASSFRLSQVQNVSAKGIGLLHGSPFPRDTLLEIQLQGRTMENRVARVVHCTRQEGGWLVGCLLNNTLSTTELERLLN
jgi:hypothetical protein